MQLHYWKIKEKNGRNICIGSTCEKMRKSENSRKSNKRENVSKNANFNMEKLLHAGNKINKL